VSFYIITALQLIKLHKNRELNVNERFGRWRECSFTAYRAETQNAWIYNPAPPICLHDLHRDNFISSTPVTERDEVQQAPFISHLSIKIKQRGKIYVYLYIAGLLNNACTPN
jgi:hypothetical protein